ncbi:MAG TPA: hypothetical protein VMC08_06115 [Bacteroidales bacterium]|nr:hypothetical protein [Bacteroidales bacterium]
MKKLILLSLVVLTSCSGFFKKHSERVVAKVFDEPLYESDLSGIVPRGTSSRDSLILVKNYIDSWVRQKLIVHQAEKNLSPEQMDFTQQLENYRNSLIIYEYENALVKQKLDTVVTDEEISSYYDANQKNFLLKDNIVQFQYVKLPLKYRNKERFRKLLLSDDPGDRSLLSDLCGKDAADYFLDDQNWILFNDLLKQIPIKMYNQEEFLKNHREVEYQDSLYTYLVRFRDFRIKDNVSPLNMEAGHIREIILNKRKMDLISKMHEDVYQEALKNNKFTVY